MRSGAEGLRQGRRAVVQATAISAVLAVVKLAAGFLGNSYALVADGFESVLDLASGSLVWGGLRVAERPPDRNHPYGHGKAESLAALLAAAILTAAGVVLALQSLRALRSAPAEPPAMWTLGILAGVIVIKELVYRVLRREGRRLESTSILAEAWHQRSDAITSWAAVVGVGVAVGLGPGYAAADRVAALFACGFILKNGWAMMRRALGEIMDEAGPENLDGALRECAAAVPGVVGVEKCFARKTGPGWLVDLHILVAGTRTVRDGHAIAHRVRDALRQGPWRVQDVLVHVEPEDAEHDENPRTPPGDPP